MFAIAFLFWQWHDQSTATQRKGFCPCLCYCHCSTSVSQEHDPLSPRRGKDWNYIALMVDYFELPKRVAEGRRQVLVTTSYLDQENPCMSQHVCSLQLFTAQALCDHNEERSGRMLCTTSPGECCSTPTLKPGVGVVPAWVCLVVYRYGWPISSFQQLLYSTCQEIIKKI